jgi:hypothetical protein
MARVGQSTLGQVVVAQEPGTLRLAVRVATTVVAVEVVVLAVCRMVLGALVSKA